MVLSILAFYLAMFVIMFPQLELFLLLKVKFELAVKIWKKKSC